MLFTKTWERHFWKEMIKVFSLFLLGFYALYTLIDYSNHSGTFEHHRFKFSDIALYYAYEFVARMDVLVPFAILIAFIKTACGCNSRNEFVALMVSGIPLKRLLRPFIYFALFMTCMIYLNTEVLQPLAIKHHSYLEELRAKKKQKKYNRPLIQQVPLLDGSSIIFQHYDKASQLIFDAYWIRSADDIYRIKSLFPYATIPEGEFVEHLERDLEGNLVITQSALKQTFPEMHFDGKTFLSTIASPNELSISALKDKLPKPGSAYTERDSQVLTSYYYKLAFPWLCLLAVIAPAPFCIRFSRTLPVFFIYALSIFIMVALIIIFDAAVILGEHQVLSPEAAIWIPFSIVFAFFGLRYSRV